MEVFWDKLPNGSCRIDAINNCFGGKHLTIEKFKTLYHAYRSKSKNQVDFELDYVQADWSRDSLLNYILWELFRLSSFTIGQFEIQNLRKGGVIRSLLDVMDLELKRFFVCNTSHVFCVRYVNNTWVSIDGGVHPTTLEQWEKDPSLTLVFPWTLARCRKGVDEMQRLVRQRFPNATKERISRAIIKDLSKREPEFFGDSQNWIALFFKYLKLCFPGEHDAVQRYEKFVKCSPLDIANALEHLPILILYIVSFSG